MNDFPKGKHYIISYWGAPTAERPKGIMLRTERIKSITEKSGRRIVNERPKGTKVIYRITVGFRGRMNTKFWTEKNAL